MQGLQLTADLRGCAAARPVMTDAGALRDACRVAVEASGLTPVGELFHRFADAPTKDGGGASGVTGVVLLAESHVAVHTWPELGAVTLDVYVCNVGRDNSARAEAVLGALLAVFEPTAVERHALARGTVGPADENDVGGHLDATVGGLAAADPPKVSTRRAVSRGRPATGPSSAAEPA